MFWAEAGGRVLALGDAAPVAEVVAHWAAEGEIAVYAGESLPGRQVDELRRGEDGALQRTERGRGLVASGSDPAWLEAIGATVRRCSGSLDATWHVAIRYDVDGARRREEGAEMSVYQFGMGSGTIDEDVAARIDVIAQRHGAAFLSPVMPEGPRYWFAAPNRGAPFDGDTAAAVWRDLELAGLASGRQLTCVER